VQRCNGVEEGEGERFLLRQGFGGQRRGRLGEGEIGRSGDWKKNSVELRALTPWNSVVKREKTWNLEL